MFRFTRRAIDELEERTDRLERVTKQLQLEWQDTLDSLRQRLAKTVRAANRLESLERSTELSSEDQGEGNPTPALDPVSERILARRRRLVTHREEQ